MEESTAWPLLRGWISRKAKTRSDSKSLKEGISPVDEARGATVSHKRDSAIALDDNGASFCDFIPLMILQKMQDAIFLSLRRDHVAKMFKTFWDGLRLRNPTL